MVGVGLRLAVAGGREAVARLAVIAAAVAVGVALLLTTFAGTNALNAQNRRYAWLETGFAGVEHNATSATGTAGLWWRLRGDYFQGKRIGRIDLAATGGDSPTPPGIPALP